MIESGQIVAVISWLFLLTIFQLSLYPWIKEFLPRVAVPVSWTAGMILTALATWYAVFCGLPLVAGLLPMVLAFVCTVAFRKTGFYKDIPSEWRYYLLFFFVFFTMLIVRAYNPDINGAEKFMDHGFLASMLRTPMVPPLDPWFAGGFLTMYYYFGHWMMAIPAMIVKIPSNFLFNLALPTIAAISAVNLYGAGHLVLKHGRLLPVLAFFVVNPYFIYLALTGTQSFTLLWDSSRVIINTINEYPLFSFLFGDVHAHVLGILAQSFLILMVITAVTCWNNGAKTRILIILLTALGLSVTPVVNSWDVLIWAPMVLATGLWLICKECPVASVVKKPVILLQNIQEMIKNRGEGWTRKPGYAGVLYLLLVPSVSMLLISPLLLGMHTQGIAGIGFVHTPTDILEFIMVHGWFFGVFFFSFRRNLIKVPWILLAIIPFFLTGYLSAALAALFLIFVINRRSGPADLLAAGGLTILLFCELFYLADNMGEIYYRMNTVFKLYIGAWLLCGTSAALMAGKELDTYIDKSQGLKVKVIKSTVILLLCLCLIIPPVAVSAIHGPHTPTLDGMAWLMNSHREDAEAIAFLQTITGEHVIVEAAGDDYQYTSRISSFTGIPTIVGWQFHEYMWRGNNPEGWYGERGNNIRSIYENPELTIPLMELYNADLLYIGPEEQQKYNVSIPSGVLRELYQSRDVIIYQHDLSKDLPTPGNDNFREDARSTNL